MRYMILKKGNAQAIISLVVKGLLAISAILVAWAKTVNVRWNNSLLLRFNESDEGRFL